MNTSMQRALALVLIINFLLMALILSAADDIQYILKTLKQANCLVIRYRILREVQSGLMIMKQFSIQ
ncbi:hypothetical protein ES705_46523 [subsurface metagenome]